MDLWEVKELATEEEEGSAPGLRPTPNFQSIDYAERAQEYDWTVTK